MSVADTGDLQYRVLDRQMKDIVTRAMIGFVHRSIEDEVLYSISLNTVIVNSVRYRCSDRSIECHFAHDVHFLACFGCHKFA